MDCYLPLSFVSTMLCTTTLLPRRERELLHFETKMRRVFMEGWFRAPHAQTAAGPRLLRGQFITELVRRQTKTKCVFSAGPKHLLVWGKCSEAEVQDISNRVSSDGTLRGSAG